MKHSIPNAESTPMAKPIETCVHCGFCLPDCPTYRVLGQEMDSPRGRIILMKEVLEGTLPLEKALPHIDRCLGCLACETSCPSGVHYRDLISPFRDRAESLRKRPLLEKARRALLARTLPSPWRFYLAARTARLARPFASLFPESLAVMLRLLPGTVTRPRRLPARSAASGETKPKARVALLAGCAQQILAPEINTATIEILTRNGIEVLVPEKQGCCGALAWHTGDGPAARAHAKRNLAAFPTEVDAIVTNAAGCGSGLQEYGLILKGTPDEARARDFASSVVDFTVLLDRHGFDPPPPLARPLRVAYHDACHLAHAQNVRAQPRRLLRAIPGVELVELPDANVCCGSAGSYNIDQPAIAADLGARKASLLAAASPDYTVTGNIGCLTQLRAHSKDARILHLAEFLRRAYAGSL